MSGKGEQLALLKESSSQHVTSAEPTKIHVSTTFFPAAVLPGVSPGDLIIQTSDSIFFCCHKRLLRSRSSNDFGALLPDTGVQSAHQGSLPVMPSCLPALHRSSSEGPPPPEAARPPLPRSLSTARYAPPEIMFVDEASAIFNVLLHMTYGISCRRYGPGIDLISGALSALVKYGLPIPDVESEIWTLLLKQVDSEPIRVYAKGAFYGMESVCVVASEHTLKASLSSLSESQAIEIGPHYLRRLFFLHLGRTEALKQILGAPVQNHPATAFCSEEGLDALQKRWRAMTAEILSQALPQNTSEVDMLSTFGPIFNSVGCRRCKENLQQRIGVVIREWGGVKRSI